MNNDTVPFNYSSIHQWNEAGRSLVDALDKFKELSLSLEKNALSEDVPPKYLAAQIDTALGSIQTFFEEQISRTRSALSQTRNRILSPIYSLPREILSRIFMNVISAVEDISQPESLEDSVTRIYLALHNLIGVCRVWRDAALDHGASWSIIPILDFPSRTRVGKSKQTNRVLLRSIERSKGGLHLVATQHCDTLHAFVLAAHASRFRTVNITTRSRSTVRKILSIFLGRSSPEPLALTELSVCQDQDVSYYYKLPKEKNYIFARDSPQQASFENLLLNLSVLRIRGPQFHWSKFTFSHRLTELHLEEVLLGYDFPHLISALSSASELRVLKVIAIKTFRSEAAEVPPEQAEIHLPNLEEFLVDDVYFNTLDCLLSSIASRSHRLTLLLNDRCRYINLPGTDPGLEEISWEAFPELLRKVAVKELLVYGENDVTWMSPSELGDLIKSVAPNLETLWIHGWDFDIDCCSALAHFSLADGSTSLNLMNLHITRGRIQDEGAFAGMAISHSESIQRMVLGAATRENAGNSTQWVPYEGRGALAIMLALVLSDFQLVDYDFHPPEFEQVPWQLW